MYKRGLCYLVTIYNINTMIQGTDFRLNSIYQQKSKILEKVHFQPEILEISKK